MIIDIQAFDSLGKTPIIFIILIDSQAYTKTLQALPLSYVEFKIIVYGMYRFSYKHKVFN